MDTGILAHRLRDVTIDGQTELPPDRPGEIKLFNLLPEEGARIIQAAQKAGIEVKPEGSGLYFKTKEFAVEKAQVFFETMHQTSPSVSDRTDYAESQTNPANHPEGLGLERTDGNGVRYGTTEQPPSWAGRREQQVAQQQQQRKSEEQQR